MTEPPNNPTTGVVPATAADSGPRRPAPPPASRHGLRRFRARWLALVTATAIALYLCWRIIDPFVSVVLWASVLVIVFYPMHRRVVRRTRRPSIAAAISCVIAAATILVPLTLLTIAVIDEARGVAGQLQPMVQRTLAQDTAVTRALEYVVGPERLAKFREEPFWSDRQFWADSLQDVGGFIAPQTIGFVGGVIGVLVKILLVLLTMYYLFRDGERIGKKLQDVLPLETRQSDELFRRTREVIHASVDGVILIAAIQALLSGLAFWVLGVPSPVLWTAAMFLLAMIPLGAVAVWLPVALFLLVSGHWIKALELGLWGGLVVSMLDNLLRPRLVGGRTRLHELVILFSVLGGLQVFGVLGMVAGPVVAAITLALLEVFRQAERPAPAAGAAAPVLAEPTILEAQDDVRNVPDEPDRRDKAPPAPANEVVAAGPITESRPPSEFRRRSKKKSGRR